MEWRPRARVSGTADDSIVEPKGVSLVRYLLLSGVHLKEAKGECKRSANGSYRKHKTSSGRRV